MSYIEKDFPIEKLNEIARREANSKKPIYQIHKWWARRLGSVFRMIILASFLPQNISEDELWRKFYQDTNLGGKIILDPFMGGGTTIVEALKLGCKVVGVDINPVAWFITKKEVEPLDIEKFKMEFERIKEAVGEKIRRYYKTTCPKCGREADVMYVFWVRKVKCSRCKSDVPLFRSFKLASLDGKHVVFCPHCGEVFEIDDVKKEVTCPSCGETFNPSHGYLKEGGKKYYLCPSCGYKGEVLKSIREEGKKPDMEMYAIEYYCPRCKRRGYKRADEDDKKLYLEVKEEFESMKNKLLFPRQEIPDGEKTKEPRNYNYKYFYELFNERQLLAISMILEEIMKIEDENIREFMILTFSDFLNANNMLCKYHQKLRKIEPLFGHHAYWVPDTPVENNAWGTRYGRGSFIRYVKKTIEAKEYMVSPYEFKITDKKTEKIRVGNNIKGVLTDSFDGLLKGEGNVILKAQTSEDLSFIPDKSVDAVITDPPYYDNIMYSELADFFYVWQKLALEDKYSEYSSEYSPRLREIVKSKAQRKNDKFYLEGLTQVFRECNRVLKDDGLMVFTFHHEKSRAWASTLRAVLDAGFRVVATYPIASETRSGVHGEGARYDIIIVCRKALGKSERISWELLKDQIYNRVKDVLERLWQTGRPLSDADMFVIAMGKSLELFSRYYPNIFKDNGKVSVEDALAEIDDIIDSILKAKEAEKLLAKDVDELTRLYCSYIVGSQDVVDYDDLHKRLSKGGIDVKVFIDEKLIEKNGAKVRITEPAERRAHIEDKEKKGKRLLTIDKVHILYSLYKDGKPLKNYLDKYGGEDVKSVAHLIYMKTGDEVYAKIAGIPSISPGSNVKQRKLSEFMGERS